MKGTRGHDERAARVSPLADTGAILRAAAGDTQSWVFCLAPQEGSGRRPQLLLRAGYQENCRAASACLCSMSSRSRVLVSPCLRPAGRYDPRTAEATAMATRTATVRLARWLPLRSSTLIARRAAATLSMIGGVAVIAGGEVERATGIEPAWPAWKAGALPLSYARVLRRDGASTAYLVMFVPSRRRASVRTTCGVAYAPFCTARCTGCGAVW
jgi:hypothetical protein